MSVSKRLLWIAFAIAIQCIYIPASQGEGGIAPRLPFEPLPVYPAWVLPYYLTYIFWLGFIYWAIYKFDDRTYRAWLVGVFFTVTIGVSVFVFFPTYIELPTIIGADLFSVALRFIQIAGGDHAALPSAHNYVTMLIVAFALRLYPARAWLWLTILALIALSTIFTGQHYILDVVSGLALGLAGYKFGWMFLERREREPASHRSP